MKKLILILIAIAVLPFSAWASRDSTLSDTTVFKASKKILPRISVVIGAPYAPRNAFAGGRIDSFYVNHLNVSTVTTQVGSGTAAAGIDSSIIANPGIGNGDLQVNIIDSTHVRPGTIAGTDLRNDAVDSTKIRRRSVSRENLRPGAADSFVSFFPDTARVMLPDTVFAKTAYKVFWGSLLDPATCWNYAQFRQLEKNTSWYNEAPSATRGALRGFPTEYEIRITTEQDSVIITDRQTGEMWMVIPGVNYGIIYTTATVCDIKFQDGILYYADTEHQPLAKIDFLRDKVYFYATSGFLQYQGNISTRATAQSDYTTLNTSPAIVNNTVNAVSVIRDPLGGVEPGTGRPLHRIQIATGGGVSESDAGISNIYDSANTRSTVGIDAGATGYMVSVVDGAASASDSVNVSYYSQTITADSFTPTMSFSKNALGSRALPSALGTITTATILSPGSVCGPTFPTVGISTPAGLVISHTTQATVPVGSAINGLTFAIDARANWPAYSATADSLGWNPQSLADSSNVWGKTLTPVATPTWGSGVIGQAATLNGTTQYFFRLNDPSFRVSNGSPFTMFAWAKSTSASNPAGLQYVAELGTTTAAIQIYFNTSGQLVCRSSDDRSNWDTSTFAQDIYDANWHFISYSGDGTNFKQYVDGELVNTTAYSNVNAAMNTDTLMVGTNTGATLFFAGSVLPIQKIKKALSASEVRWLYQQGLHGIQSNVDPNDALHSATVSYVTADPNGKWFAAGTTDSVTIFDEYGIPKYRYASPGDNIQTVALRSSPGTDSLSVGIGTTTKVKWIQTDPRIADLAGGYSGFGQAFNAQFVGTPYCLPPLISGKVVVDSSGYGNVTDINSAVAICSITGLRKIEVRKGTYAGCTIGTADIVVTGAGRSVIVDGGITSHAISITAVNVTVQDLSAQTTAGGGTSYYPVITTGAESSILRVYVRSADDVGIVVGAARFRVEDCDILNADGVGINTDSNSDDGQLLNNRVKDQGGVSINVNAGSNNNVVIGNRTDGAITDSGTGTIGVASNNTAAY